MSPSSGVESPDGERFHGDEGSYRYCTLTVARSKIVTNRIGIILIPRCGRCRVGDRVSTLTDIHGTPSSVSVASRSIVERADGPHAGGRVVVTLRNCSIVAGGGQFRSWQKVRQGRHWSLELLHCW